MVITIHAVLRCVLLNLAILCGLAVVALGQDTTGLIRINNGAPVGLKRITITQMNPALQTKAMTLAVRNGYKTNRDWDDTVKYWTDERSLRGVSFINSSYEYTTVIFNAGGKRLQIATYPNPEFKETSQIVASIEEKGYYMQGFNSPIGSIIKYQTNHDTWYEADAYESRAPQTIVGVLLDKKFQFIGLKKY
jgi:hypothetical protein